MAKKNLPVCPIPGCAARGDTVVLRNGDKRTIYRIDRDPKVMTAWFEEDSPNGIMLSGHYPETPEWDCVALLWGKTNEVKVGTYKPKLTPNQRLAGKLAKIVCHDNPDRTMHLGTTTMLSMSVKDFNALIARAVKALNGT
jgi:hypothetical protein